MPVQYEYGFMFHTIDVSKMGNINSEDGSAMFGQELAALTQGLNESLPQFDGGNWEILSHDITFSGLLALISFLDSSLKSNRRMGEYIKRRQEVKAFSWAMIEFVCDNLCFSECDF